jgi:hypothetical protein
MSSIESKLLIAAISFPFATRISGSFAPVAGIVAKSEIRFDITVRILMNRFSASRGNGLVCCHDEIPIGFVKIEDIIWRISLGGSEKLAHEKCAFLIINCRSSLRSRPSEAQSDPLQEPGQIMV